MEGLSKFGRRLATENPRRADNKRPCPASFPSTTTADLLSGCADRAAPAHYARSPSGLRGIVVLGKLVIALCRLWHPLLNVTP